MQTHASSGARERPGFDGLDCRPWAELGAADWEAWQSIVDANPELQSPFFSAAFARIVGRSSDDVWVGRLWAHGEIVGFFPFHRRRFGVAHPLGRGLSDHHGVIAGARLKLEPRELLRRCRLRAFEFHHLLAAQTSFCPYASAHAGSPIVDLGAGFAEYRRRVDGRSSIWSKVEAARRRLERAAGPVRVELDCRERRLLELMRSLKSAQYHRTGGRDIFTDAWTRQILQRVFESREPTCAGLLSVLWAGDRPVALHLGMRSRAVLHYWFPTYDPTFARHSPGSILLADLARASSDLGVRVVDLGKGDSAYKARFSNGAIPLLEGRVELSSAMAIWRRVRGLVARLARQHEFRVDEWPTGRAVTR